MVQSAVAFKQRQRCDSSRSATKLRWCSIRSPRPICAHTRTDTYARTHTQASAIVTEFVHIDVWWALSRWIPQRMSVCVCVCVHTNLYGYALAHRLSLLLRHSCWLQPIISRLRRQPQRRCRRRRRRSVRVASSVPSASIPRVPLGYPLETRVPFSTPQSTP